jgi:Tol biopolymer transport system component
MLRCWLRAVVVLIIVMLTLVGGMFAVLRAEPLHWFAFAASEETGVFNLYIARGDGRGLRRIADGVAPFLSPAWSPDGRRIAFTRELDRRGMYVVGSSGDGEMRLSDRFITDAVWSPDGVWLYFIATQEDDRLGASNLFRVRADGRDMQQLTTLAKHVAGSPAVSPDGEWVAFVATDCATICSPSDGGDLYLVGAAGGDLRLLSADRHIEFISANRAPMWLDDQTLLFASSRDIGTFQMYTLRLSDGTLRRLTDNPQRSTLRFGWRADGWLLVKNDTIYFDYGYFRMRLDGTEHHSLFPDAERVPGLFVAPSVSLPAYSPHTSFTLFSGVRAYTRAGDYQTMYVLLEDGRYFRLFDAQYHYMFRPAWSPTADIGVGLE